jgi:hypothetical protein
MAQLVNDSISLLTDAITEMDGVITSFLVVLDILQPPIDTIRVDAM